MSRIDERMYNITLIYKTTTPREIIPFRTYKKRDVAQCTMEMKFELPIGFKLNYYSTINCTTEFIKWLCITFKEILECNKFMWTILIHDLNYDLKEAIKDLYDSTPS